MENLVSKIAEERKSHIDHIDNLTLGKIRSIERKSYVPRRRTKDELHIEAKALVKQSWRGSGNQNSVFSAAPIMKPKLLDPWTLSRVQAPEKASTKFFFSKWISKLLTKLICLFIFRWLATVHLHQTAH